MNPTHRFERLAASRCVSLRSAAILAVRSLAAATMERASRSAHGTIGGSAAGSADVVLRVRARSRDFLPMWIWAGVFAALMSGCVSAPTLQRVPAVLPPPPATPVSNVAEQHHGQIVDDSYRWLEATQEPRVQAWMRAQAERTRGVLDRIAGREALLARMLEIERDAPPRVSRVSVVSGGALFMLEQLPGASQPRLVARDSLEAPARVVVDPASFGPRHAIDYFIPSPDGRFVAYGLSESGSENASLYLRDVARAIDIVGPIAGAKFNGSSPYRWSADGSSVHFQTSRDAKDAVDSRETYQWPRLWRLAARPGAVPELVSDGLRGVGPQRTANEFMAMLQFGRSPWQVAYFEDGVRRELRALVRRAMPTRPAGAASAGDAWRTLIGHADGVWRFELHEGRVFALTHRGAERFRIVSTPIESPDWPNAQVVLPEQAGVLTDFVAAADALYVVVLEGGRDRLLRVPYDRGAATEIRLPFPGAVRLAAFHADRAGGLIELGGWTERVGIHAVNADSKASLLTALQPRSRSDSLPGVASRIEQVVSHDGVRVPLSIVERGGRRTGPRPTVIVAYGAYGFSQEPRLRTEWMPWLERGFVMATCHVRGGGEYGDAWYRAGRKQTKPNTWKDLIACAEHLVAQGVSTPRQLGIMGWSAGGIAVGRALTERPDLFAAAAPGVGVLDAVRAEVEPNGPPNVVEFGTVKNADEFPALWAMSAYHHVRPGTRYPAVILPHGANDPRVAVWHSSKMAAALQAASPDVPVLLNIDFDAGHGRGSATAQRLGTFADSIAFMLWRFGVPGFELR